MQRKVDALLKEFAFRKMKNQVSEYEDDQEFEDDLIDDEPGVAGEMLPGMANAVQELQKRRSRQIRNKQRSWQESEEGHKMNEFRKTLPAYQEKDALLAAIARNQVLLASNNISITKGSMLVYIDLCSEWCACRWL